MTLRRRRRRPSQQVRQLFGRVSMCRSIGLEACSPAGGGERRNHLRVAALPALPTVPLPPERKVGEERSSPNFWLGASNDYSRYDHQVLHAEARIDEAQAYRLARKFKPSKQKQHRPAAVLPPFQHSDAESPVQSPASPDLLRGQGGGLLPSPLVVPGGGEDGEEPPDRASIRAFVTLAVRRVSQVPQTAPRRQPCLQWCRKPWKALEILKETCSQECERGPALGSRRGT